MNLSKSACFFVLTISPMILIGCGGEDGGGAKQVISSPNPAPESKEAPRPPVVVGDLKPVALKKLPPGLSTETLERSGLSPIRYAISVPEGMTDDKEAPLVLALHYGGFVDENMGQDMIENLYGPGFQELKAIIVAPHSIDGEWSAPENEEAVMFLVESMLKTYPIDPKKVVVSGYSMGGLGTWYFASRYPNRFTAAIPLAGDPRLAVDVPGAGVWKTPIYAIHSKTDAMLPIGPTKTKIDSLKASGANASLLVLDGVSHAQRDRFVEPLKKAVVWLKAVWND